MAQNAPRKNILTRCLAAVALIGIYCVSIVGTSALLLTAGSSTAEARGGGRGRGYGRGYARGRGYGRGYGYRGYGFVAPVVRGCYWSPRWGRTICPY